MASLSAVHVWAVAVLAVLRSRSALGSPYGSLPPPIYATADDAVTRSPDAPSFNVTTADRDVRTDQARHSYDQLQHAACGTRLVSHQLNQRGWPQTKIIGGSTTPYGAYPWQVELQAYKDGWEHHCGGALISETIALTAAHCLKDFKKSQLRIIVGKHNLAKNDKHEKTYRVQKALVHPEFRKDGPHSHDIAILKINSLNSKGVKFDSHVQPICLPDYYTKPNDVDWCTVTGWGAQKQDDMTSLSKVLKAASVPLLDLETCRHDDVYGGRHQFILDSMLCAGSLEGGVDACGGDSGGPLACQVNGKFILTGVVSWGDGCGKKNRPGVYTRVSYYTEWLKKVMTELQNN